MTYRRFLHYALAFTASALFTATVAALSIPKI
jgi:hypothetical protein